MADIKATSNTSNQPHDKMETENLYDPNDKFSINQFLSNSDLTPDSTAFLTEDLKKLQEPGLLLEDHDDDNDKSKELLRYVIRNQERLREQGEEAREEQTINRQEAQIARERQREEAIRRQQEETARASAQLERQQNEAKNTKSPVRGDLKKAFTEKADTVVYKVIKDTADYAHDKVGDAAEAIGGKDLRGLGGSSLRAADGLLSGDFDKAAKEGARAINKGGNIVESVAGKDVRSFGGHVLRGEFGAAAGQVGNGLTNAASAAKDIAADTVTSATKTVSGWLPTGWGMGK